MDCMKGLWEVTLRIKGTNIWTVLATVCMVVAVVWMILATVKLL